MLYIIHFEHEYTRKHSGPKQQTGSGRQEGCSKHKTGHKNIQGKQGRMIDAHMVVMTIWSRRWRKQSLNILEKERQQDTCATDLDRQVNTQAGKLTVHGVLNNSRQTLPKYNRKQKV